MIDHRAVFDHLWATCTHRAIGQLRDGGVVWTADFSGESVTFRMDLYHSPAVMEISGSGWSARTYLTAGQRPVTFVGGSKGLERIAVILALSVDG